MPNLVEGRELQDGDIVLLQTTENDGEPSYFVATSSALDGREQTVVSLSAVPISFEAACDTPPAWFEVVLAQDGYLGLRSPWAGDRFLQARRKAPNTTFFSQHLGVWEQWQVQHVLSRGKHVLGWPSRHHTELWAIHLTNRQLPAVHLVATALLLDPPPDLTATSTLLPPTHPLDADQATSYSMRSASQAGSAGSRDPYREQLTSYGGSASGHDPLPHSILTPWTHAGQPGSMQASHAHGPVMAVDGMQGAPAWAPHALPHGHPHGHPHGEGVSHHAAPFGSPLVAGPTGAGPDLPDDMEASQVMPPLHMGWRAAPLACLPPPHGFSSPARRLVAPPSPTPEPWIPTTTTATTMSRVVEPWISTSTDGTNVGPGGPQQRRPASPAVSVVEPWATNTSTTMSKAHQHEPWTTTTTAAMQQHHHRRPASPTPRRTGGGGSGSGGGLVTPSHHHHGLVTPVMMSSVRRRASANDVVSQSQVGSQRVTQEEAVSSFMDDVLELSQRVVKGKSASRAAQVHLLATTWLCRRAWHAWCQAGAHAAHLRACGVRADTARARRQRRELARVIGAWWRLVVEERLQGLTAQRVEGRAVEGQLRLYWRAWCWATCENARTQELTAQHHHHRGVLGHVLLGWHAATHALQATRATAVTQLLAQSMGWQLRRMVRNWATWAGRQMLIQRLCVRLRGTAARRLVWRVFGSWQGLAWDALCRRQAAERMCVVRRQAVLRDAFCGWVCLLAGPAVRLDGLAGAEERARAHAVRSALRRAWRGWQSAAAWAGGRRAKVQAVRDSWRKRVLLSWHAYARQLANAKESAGHLLSLVMSRLVARAFHAWAVAREVRRSRQLVEAAVSKAHSENLGRKVVRAWWAVAAHQHGQKRKVRALSHGHAVRVAGRVVRAWAGWAARARSVRYMAAVRQLRHVTLALLGWRDVAQRKAYHRTLVMQCVARGQARLLGAAFWAWVQEAEEAGVRRGQEETASAASPALQPASGVAGSSATGSPVLQEALAPGSVTAGALAITALAAGPLPAAAPAPFTALAVAAASLEEEEDTWATLPSVTVQAAMRGLRLTQSMRAWHGVAARRSHCKQAVRDMTAARRRARLSTCLHALHAAARHMADVRDHVDGMVRSMHRKLATAALLAWRAVAVSFRQVEVVCNRLGAMHSRQLQVKCVVAWRGAVQQGVSGRRFLAGIMAEHRKRVMRGCMTSWSRALAKARAQQVAALELVATRGKRLQHAVLVYWHQQASLATTNNQHLARHLAACRRPRILGAVIRAWAEATDVAQQQRRDFPWLCRVFYSWLSLVTHPGSALTPTPALRPARRPAPWYLDPPPVPLALPAPPPPATAAVAGGVQAMQAPLFAPHVAAGGAVDPGQSDPGQMGLMWQQQQQPSGMLASQHMGSGPQQQQAGWQQLQAGPQQQQAGWQQQLGCAPLGSQQVGGRLQQPASVPGWQHQQPPAPQQLGSNWQQQQQQPYGSLQQAGTGWQPTPQQQQASGAPGSQVPPHISATYHASRQQVSHPPLPSDPFLPQPAISALTAGVQQRLMAARSLASHTHSPDPPIAPINHAFTTAPDQPQPQQQQQQYGTQYQRSHTTQYSVGRMAETDQQQQQQYAQQQPQHHGPPHRQPSPQQLDYQQAGSQHPQHQWAKASSIQQAPQPQHQAHPHPAGDEGGGGPQSAAMHSLLPQLEARSLSALHTQHLPPSTSQDWLAQLALGPPQGPGQPLSRSSAALTGGMGDGSVPSPPPAARLPTTALSSPASPRPRNGHHMVLLTAVSPPRPVGGGGGSGPYQLVLQPLGCVVQAAAATTTTLTSPPPAVTTDPKLISAPATNLTTEVARSGQATSSEPAVAAAQLAAVQVAAAQAAAAQLNAAQLAAAQPTLQAAPDATLVPPPAAPLPALPASSGLSSAYTSGGDPLQPSRQTSASQGASSSSGTSSSTGTAGPANTGPGKLGPLLGTGMGTEPPPEHQQHQQHQQLGSKAGQAVVHNQQEGIMSGGQGTSLEASDQTTSHHMQQTWERPMRPHHLQAWDPPMHPRHAPPQAPPSTTPAATAGLDPVTARPSLGPWAAGLQASLQAHGLPSGPPTATATAPAPAAPLARAPSSSPASNHQHPQWAWRLGSPPEGAGVAAAAPLWPTSSPQGALMASRAPGLPLPSSSSTSATMDPKLLTTYHNLLLSCQELEGAVARMGDTGQQGRGHAQGGSQGKIQGRESWAAGPGARRDMTPAWERELVLSKDPGLRAAGTAALADLASDQRELIGRLAVHSLVAAQVAGRPHATTSSISNTTTTNSRKRQGYGLLF